MARRRRNDFGNINERDLANAANAFMRLPPQARVMVIILLLAAGAVFAVVYYKQHHPPVATGPAPTTTTTVAQSADMLLGNPSGATADPANRNNYLMLKPDFSLSYNNENGTPNWVSWRVTESDLGTAPRKVAFDPDIMLPNNFTKVLHGDYSGSGFDRGHLCPHSDRAANTDMSYATFVMTNIIPQAPHVNQRAWAQLENYCRDLVRQEHARLYVIAGPSGRGGRGSEGFREVIGKSTTVTVPAECWKIVVAVPAGGGEDDLAKINARTRVITVVMPNDNDAVSYAWSGFRRSPGEVERRTGYRFFDRLAPDVAAALRDKTDAESIPAPRPPQRGTREE